LYGFQLSSQVLVSADLAQQKPKRARWTALRATRMGMVVAVATAFALWVGRDSIANTLRGTWHGHVERWKMLVNPGKLMVIT
jgi:Na+-driven multidrug efflux pump